MERLNKEDMELLLEQGGRKPCISIYMPTQKGREGAKENSTRFKNLLNKTEKQLEARGVNSSEQKELLDSARKLISESYFWANQSEGFAYFISPGFSRSYRLSLQFEEMSIVRDSFHLKPLFKLLSTDGQFYILALSQQDVRLMRGTRSIIEEIDLSSIIEKLEADLGDELFEPTLQFHTGAPDASGTRSAIFHGHGGAIDGFLRERLLNYFRLIDREIQGLIDDKGSPLILACVDFLIPLYKETSKYPVLFEESIKGNPENINAQDLHQKALDLIMPYFQKNQEVAKARYHELKGTGKTSNDILEILPAAYHGRISDIFVTPGIQQWGSYDPETEEVSLSEGPDSGDEDLIDLAAAKSYSNSGNVYAVEPGQMPDQSPAVAIFRW